MGVITAAAGLVSQNYIAAGAGIVAAASAISTSVYSTIQSSISSQQALEAKKAQLAEQKTAVAGADDLSLLKYYTGNNFPKIVTYNLSDVMAGKIFDLFHFCGYKAEYMGVPSTNSRLRFNYIQADIDIDETASAFLTRNLNNEIIENFKSKWAEGITIIHLYNATWDFEQKYENWESTLESYLQ